MRLRPSLFFSFGLLGGGGGGGLFGGGSPFASGVTTPPPVPSAGTNINVEWRGEHAYVSGTHVECTLPGERVDKYLFEDTQMQTIEVDTGPGNYGKEGQYLRAGTGQWFEAGRQRSLIFKTHALSGSPDGDRKPRVLSEVRIMNNINRWLHWTEEYGAFVDSMIVIPDGYDVFRCDFAEFNARGSKDGQVEGTLRMNDFALGTYLPLGYSPDSLRVFRPCDQISRCAGGTCGCAVVDGTISCNGRSVTFAEVLDGAETADNGLPPEGGGPENSPGVAMTPGPPVPSAGTGINVEWRGERAYVAGTHAECALPGGRVDKYLFRDTQMRTVGLDTGPGKLGKRGQYLRAGTGQWFEAGRQRSIVFKTYSLSGSPDGDRKPQVLSEVRIMNNINRWLYWTKDYGAFVDSMIIIPNGYDVFRCHYAEFNARGSRNGQIEGKLRMNDFVVGTYLPPSYSPDTFRAFRPCDQVSRCAGGTCSCAVVDGSISCNGRSVTFAEVYPPSGGAGTAGAKAGTLTASGAGRGAGTFRRGAAAAIAVGAVAAMITGAI